MVTARRLMLVSALMLPLGCTTLAPPCPESCPGGVGCEPPGVEIGGDVTFAPRPAIPHEAVRRPPPPPEAAPPGRFSPVPVRPVFSPQTPLGW